VVTSLVFQSVPAPEVTNVHLRWPFSRVADVIAAWQSWAPDLPDEIAASLKVTADGDVERPPSVDVYGAVLGGRPDTADPIDELVARAGSDPISSFRQHMSFPETMRFWEQLGEPAEGGRVPQAPEPVWLFSKSEFFGRPLPTEAIAALLDTFSGERIEGESRELDFMPWGGAYNRVAPDATAFVHRAERFQLKHAVVVQPEASTAKKEAAHRQGTRSWASVHPWGSGRVFQNFADPDLPDWAEAYYGPNRHRLGRIKARYDPEGVWGKGASPVRAEGG
jgi:hypothetical protein